MAFLKTVFLIISCLLFSIGSDQFTDHAGADELIIGTSTGYPPYYFDADGALKGLCIDLIDKTAATLGFTVTYKQYPWKRLLHYGKNGKVDAVMPLFRTPERETYLYFFHNALAVEENRFFIKKERRIRYDGNLNSLKSYQIGIVDEYSYGSAFDKADFLQKVIMRNDNRLVQLFAKDRLDIGLGNKLVVLYHAKQAGIDNEILFLDPFVTQKSLYIGFSKVRQTRAKAEAFSRALNSLKLTPFYLNLMKHYQLDN